jgi:D-sedoheptulose 7-phosphate isomerase
MFMDKTIKKHIDEHVDVLKSLSDHTATIGQIAKILIHCLSDKGNIFWCGNGGSASDSQHLSGELIGRFVDNRKSLRSIALSSGDAVGTCIANDFGFVNIFSRQLEGLARPGDVLIGITTSGNSQNILNAFKAANSLKVKTIGFLGKGGGKALKYADVSIVIKSKTTARIQEMHILIGHILCDLIEEGLNLK